MIPIGTAVYNSFRFYESDTQVNGPFSAPNSLTLQNYRDAWRVGEMGKTFGNTAFIVLPALFITLLLSAAVAYACTRFSWKFNIAFLVLFTAGNLMPQQVLFQPLFQIYKRVPWPDILSDTDTGNLLGTKIAVILIHIAFQVGFCTFVLANYMKTIPKELGEAAAVDGAGVLRQFFQVILPLTRPALAALGNARVHLALQRLLLGCGAAQPGRRAADHLVDRRAERSVRDRLQPHRRSLDHDRLADLDRVPGPAEAVHLGPDTRCQQGLSAPPGPEMTADRICDDGMCQEREPIGELRPIVTGEPSGIKRSEATYPLGSQAHPVISTSPECTPGARDDCRTMDLIHLRGRNSDVIVDLAHGVPVLVYCGDGMCLAHPVMSKLLRRRAPWN